MSTIAVSFLDHWSAAIIWFLVTVGYFVLLGKLSEWVCRDCEKVVLEESRSELIDMAFEKLKTSQLIIVSIVVPVICFVQILEILGGIEGTLFQLIGIMFCATIGCLSIYTLFRRLKQAKRL